MVMTSDSIQKLSRVSTTRLIWTLGGAIVLRYVVVALLTEPRTRSIGERPLRVANIKTSTLEKPENVLAPIDRDHLIVRLEKEREFPAVCDDESMKIQEFQLPEFRCKKTEKRIWNQHCSYSYATRCPDPQWIKSPTTAVLVDVCGEAESRPMLRLLGRMTSDAPFEDTVEAWRLASARYKENTSDGKGQCLIYPNNAKVVAVEPNKNAAIHCLSTSDDATETNKLKKAADELPDKFKGYIKVADYATKIERYLNDLKGPIDFLRFGITVATPEFIYNHGSLLESKVKYFEFVNSHTGEWENFFLSDIVDLLQKHRFVCYFAGAFGNIWRLTGCFSSYFDLRFWSNVACVNVDLDPELLDRTEIMYKATLDQKHEIKYMNEKFIGTDGNRNSVM